MKCLDLSFPTPEDNLACDEVLLDECEAGKLGETLRFWESPDYFVVVGYGNSVATEVDQSACEAKGIPILRRCSGGGTVVQGPGCLSYSLILEIKPNGPMETITAANQFIMERNRQALENLLQQPVSIRGHTDLAMNGLKFSGNAQRRRKRSLLFHGSLLLDFNLALIGELLPMPSKEPDYRLNRPHKDFLINLKLPSERIKAALGEAWSATEMLTSVPLEAVRLLSGEKYRKSEWNLKF